MPEHLVYVLPWQKSIAQMDEKSVLSDEIDRILCPGGYDVFFDALIEELKRPKTVHKKVLRYELEDENEEFFVVRNHMNPDHNPFNKGEPWSIFMTYNEISKNTKGAFGKIVGTLRGIMSEKIREEFWFIHRFPLRVEYYQVPATGEKKGLRRCGLDCSGRVQAVIDKVIDDLNIADPETELAKEAAKSASGRTGCKCF